MNQGKEIELKKKLAKDAHSQKKTRKHIRGPIIHSIGI